MPDRLRDGIADTWLVLKESFLSFDRNNHFERAAAFAYYGFFAFIPLLLLVIYITGHYILSSQTALKAVNDFTAQLFPEAGKVLMREVESLSRHRKLWGFLSLVSLFWSITPLAGALRAAFARIYKTDADMHFLKAKLLDAAAVLIILVFFVLLVLSELFYTDVIRVMHKTPLLLDAVSFIIPLLLTAFFMALFYRAFSPVKIKTSHLLAGAFFTSLLWAVMRPVFTMFLKSNPSYGFTFGSLKAVFILFVWVYYAFVVILMGGEIIAAIRKKDALLLKGLFSSVPPSKGVKKMIGKRFVKEFREGDVIFRDGDKGETMFYVLTGEVSISHHDQLLKVMGPGDYFGEMSLLIGTPRTATAVATKPATRLAAVTRNNFDVILGEEPKIVFAVLKEMATRLKATTEHI